MMRKVFFSWKTVPVINQYIFLRYREKMFLSIIKPLFIKYQQILCEKGYIDFNDMINLSTASIQEGKLDISYKYIIVDEYIRTFQ
jgi:DNA helicase-4